MQRQRKLENKKAKRLAEIKELLEDDEEGEDCDEDGIVYKFRYRTVPANNYGLSIEEVHI